MASDVALPSPDPSTLPAAAWRQLSSSMIGPLLHPGHAQFEPLHRPATNRHPAAHPRAIARCATPADVAHAIAFARRHGLEIAVRGAGPLLRRHRQDQFLLEYTATSDPAQPAATRRAAYQWLSHVRESLDGRGTGRSYQNFPDTELADPLCAYYGHNLPRLRDVKRRYDPDDFFHHRQSIPPGTGKPIS